MGPRSSWELWSKEISLVPTCNRTTHFLSTDLCTHTPQKAYASVAWHVVQLRHQTRLCLQVSCSPAITASTSVAVQDSAPRTNSSQHNERTRGSAVHNRTGCTLQQTENAWETRHLAWHAVRCIQVVPTNCQFSIVPLD